MSSDDVLECVDEVDATVDASESSEANDSGDSPPSGIETGIETRIGTQIETRVVRGRELARLLQRQAYQRAKEMRAKDPKFLAMKALAKERRRAAGKAVRERRKAEQVVERAVEKKESSTRRAGERAERDQKLRELLTRGAASAKTPVAATSEAPAPPGNGEDANPHAEVVLNVRSRRSDYNVN